jgi:ECF sigma factor
MNDVTRILSSIEQGDSAAAGQLLPLVYQELRRLATQKLAHEPSGLTLQPSDLVDHDGRLPTRSLGHNFPAPRLPDHP